MVDYISISLAKPGRVSLVCIQHPNTHTLIHTPTRETTGDMEERGEREEGMEGETERERERERGRERGRERERQREREIERERDRERERGREGPGLVLWGSSIRQEVECVKRTDAVPDLPFKCFSHLA